MSQTNTYIDRKVASRSYRPKSNLMSPGLLRAREPYRLRNAMTGIALGAFAIGVWAYSISAVKQDVFDDVDAEARALAGAGAEGSGPNGTLPTTAAESDQAALPVSPVDGTPVPVSPPALARRGVLVKLLDERVPGLFDPVNKTLVWGAPPIDGDRKGGR